MYYIIMYYISKLFEMRFCYTVVFTSNYAQIPRPIISVNSSFLRGQFAKVVKLENFFEFLQNSWAVIRTCARQTEQPSNLITMVAGVLIEKLAKHSTHSLSVIVRVISDLSVISSSVNLT